VADERVRYVVPVGPALEVEATGVVDDVGHRLRFDELLDVGLHRGMSDNEGWREEEKKKKRRRRREEEKKIAEIEMEIIEK
jgi:hypothetical protein